MTDFLRSTPGWLVPALLLLAVLGALAWRLGPAGTDDGSRPTARTTAAPLALRTAAGARVSVPRSWHRVGRGDGPATWASAGRAHTVTVASIEASVLPLPGVVDAVVEDAREQLAGLRLVEGPVPLQLRDAPRGDAAMLVRFTVPGDDGATIEVAQVWRRDARNERDVVATWTSSDGHWPAPPRASIPSAVPSR